MTRRLLNATDALASNTARGLTRRRLFRGASAAALGAAFATTLGPGRSRAYIYPYGHVCGPSPYCNHSLRCDGWYCSGGNVRWAQYGGSYCSTSTGTNCWSHCDSDTGWVRYICCDCCVGEWPGLDVNDHNPAPCSGCPAGNWYRCICHGASGSC